MVQLKLERDKFINNRFTFAYGNREALFTIVDEEFAGLNRLGRINRMTIVVQKSNGFERRCTTIIGLGDGIVGIKSDDPRIRGTPITKDNMEQCTILLAEDADE